MHVVLHTCLYRSGPAFALADFPGCKRLVDAYRKIFRIPNKTPLSVLYEYASRLNLTVSPVIAPPLAFGDKR